MSFEKNIILLHGWGAATYKLDPLKAELEKLGWKVLLPELAGFGAPPPKSVWGIKEYSDYILEQARKEFKRSSFFVFGHSFGGGIAINLASEKVNNISGIVLCASRGISRGKLLKRVIFSFLAKSGKIFLLVPGFAVTFKRLLYKAAREHDYEKTQGIMKEVFKKVISEDLKPKIKKIVVPTLILWGDQDRVTKKKDAIFINKSIIGSELYMFKNEGHRLPYNAPNDIAGRINLWYKNL